MCTQILHDEGIVSRLKAPDIDVDCWESAFHGLKAQNENIMIECEDIDDENDEFYIGRIEKVYQKLIYFRHFDADGIWDDVPIKLFYKDMTSVTFNSRYVNAFSKYIEPYSED